MLCGILSIATGVLTFAYLGLTALLLLYFIAFWAILHGVMEIAAAIHLRKVINNEWMLILTGVCSMPPCRSSSARC